MRYRLRLGNAAQVVCVCSQREPFKKGAAMNQIAVVENGTVLVDLDGKIAWVGPAAASPVTSGDTFDLDLDMTGKCILPGLVDGHTHPVWSGDRVHEFEMKLAGATYMDIHKMGGGIGFTVQHTREATEQHLLELLLRRMDRMLSHGSTLIEAKSGYGLEAETEMKMLKVLKMASERHPVSISATYLGAHSVPKGKTAQEATEDILLRQLPLLKDLKERGEILADNVDVFFDKGIFEKEDTRKILEAGKALGLALNFHGDELHPVGAAELGGELKATAISHLEEISDEGIAAMAKENVFGVLLPTTAYVLRIQPPPARKLIDSGVPVALGSDFNPNAHCMSMPFVMNLACVLMRMTVNEALVAATINAAASLKKSNEHGSIEVGKWANLVVLNHADWRHLIYELVDPPIQSVFIRGEQKYECKK